MENGRSSGDELNNELRKQHVAIDRQMQLLRTKAKIERSSVAKQLQSLEEEQNAISRRRIEQQQRLDAASIKLRRLKSAARGGAVTEFEVLRQEDEQAVLRQTSGQMQQNEISLKREREQLTARARTLPIETEQLISDLNSQRSKLQQQITQLKSERRIVLKSPIAGKLASLEVHPGSAVAPNQLLATVVPENLTLAAEVYVPSSAVGFIKRGQRVRLMYDAFPARKFGAFAGKVDYVSDFILLPSEVPQTFFLREATFKIRISIERDYVALEAGSAPLKPGMLLAAEIVLESRSLVDWLFEPIRLRHKDAG